MAVSRSWLRSTALAVAAALGTTGLATGSAHAQSPALLQCLGTESVTYSPALTFQARDVTITTNGQYTSCADSGGQVKSGSYGERFTIFAGCNDLLSGGFTTQRTFVWNTGDTSVIDASGTSTAVAGQVVTTITGTVVQGRFQGRSVVQTITLPQPGLLQCLTTGVTGATGPTTLTFT